MNTTSHASVQHEIENGRTNGAHGEERICKLCDIDVEDEYDFTCKRPTYQDILGPPPPLQTIAYTRYKEISKYI